MLPPAVVVAATSRYPSRTMLPPITMSPGCVVRGRASPVIRDSSTRPPPPITVPSRRIASPVMTGEAILLDGRVIGGGGLVDESLITGEARPRTTQPGDMVIGGSMVREGYLEVAATTTAGGSMVGQGIAVVEDALAGKNSDELIADRISRSFVPLVLAAAA